MLQLQINMFLIRMQAKQVHRELSHLHRVHPWHHPRLRHIPGRCHSDPRHDPPARFTVSSFRYLYTTIPACKKMHTKSPPGRAFWPISSYQYLYHSSSKLTISAFRLYSSYRRPRSSVSISPYWLSYGSVRK